MNNLLEIKNLSMNYTDFCLNDISFNIPKGSIVGFIGENGAGKTTTINLILNAISKKSGSIKIFGMDNIKNETEIKERIGVVLDSPSFNKNFTPADIGAILKNIYKNWSDKLFDSYLHRFSLDKNKKIKEYSKGMIAKLNIAAALSHNPDLLILDGATSGLDPVIRNEILDIFLEFIQDENKSILISSHITSDLEKISDYITYINNGKIIISEDKDSLLHNYGIIKCSKEDAERIDSSLILSRKENAFGTALLTNNKKKISVDYPNLIIDYPTLEDIMLFYTGGNN